MSGNKLNLLLDGIETTSNSGELGQLFELVAETYGLATVAYLGAGVGRKRERNEPYVVATYSLEWIERYKQERYVTIDPVVQIGMRRMLLACPLKSGPP